VRMELRNAVSKPDEYRRFAATALDMAEKASDPGGKKRLVDIAEAWLNLAERSNHQPLRSDQRLGEHPLITATLGRDRV
jgi:hypothetical protein